MPNLSTAQRDFLIEKLRLDEDIPVDFKNLLFPPERQEYELVYTGKERVEDILADTMGVPLQPIKMFGSCEIGAWSNMLIFGDNLQAMKTLLRMKNEGRLINSDGTYGIKLVYIDPPFATKQEFQGSQSERAYQDKVAGAKFIEFLRKRLVLLYELLSPNGCIYVHLDYRKVHYTKLLLDEIFGESNFVNEIIWQRTASHNDPGRYGCVHDTILLYRKGNDFVWNEPKTEQSQEYVDKFFIYAESPDKKQWTKLKKGEDAPEGWERYALGNLASPHPRPNLTYEYKGYKPPANGWKVKQERMEELDEKGLLHFPEKKTGRIRTKQYLRDTLGNKAVPDVWLGISPLQAQSSEKKNYPTQKPEALLGRIISASSNPGDIVLDCFAGSGTSLAVAEKLKRHWIGIDCGKLAIYTIQKRLLNLKSHIGEKGKGLKAQPFTLYNAGLYNFAQLKRLPWEDWRFFALHLFQCRDEKHRVGGIQLDGYRGSSDVLVFNHLQDGGVVLDYGFIDDLHEQIGGRVGTKFFVIAPAASVAFLEDYLDKGRVRYYVLRIPYSIINELHTRDFEAITQPIDENHVNETVEAVGFDFIRLPDVTCSYSIRVREKELLSEAVIKITAFRSKAMVKGTTQLDNLESLSLVMIDFNYTGGPFEVDLVYYASDIKKNNWEIQMPLEAIGNQIMIIYTDIYGNEFREIKNISDFRNVDAENNALEASNA